MKVYDWFQALLSRIEPLQSEIERAEGHAQTIKSRLGQSFNLKKFMVAGSHSRGTAIKDFSDVDYFGVISRDDARKGDSYISSSTMLSKIKKDLSERYTNTEVGIDGQSVIVKFGGGDFSVDVVPAIFWGMTSKNWPIYKMPDGYGEWMETSPEVHNKYLKQADQKSRGLLKYVVQLIKYWRECRNPRIPISSFHIELLLADYGLCNGAKSYSQCLTEAFQLLAQRECRAYRDPVEISGNVVAVKTDNQRISVLNTIIYARDHAKAALYAESQNDYGEAIRQWKIVFNQ